MASGMASYVESLAREVKEMDDRIEYLASKRLWAENKLKTEKLEIRKELTLKLQVANTKKVKKDTDRELAAKRREYIISAERARSREFDLPELFGPPLFEERAEVEARSDTEFDAENPWAWIHRWVGPCGTRSSVPEAGISVGMATPLGLAPDIFVAGPPTSGYSSGDEVL